MNNVNISIILHLCIFLAQAGIFGPIALPEKGFTRNERDQRKIQQSSASSLSLHNFQTTHKLNQ